MTQSTGSARYREEAADISSRHQPDKGFVYNSSSAVVLLQRCQVLLKCLG